MKSLGRVAVVTGSNKGVGFQVAQQLASSGLFSHLVLACRNPALARSAVEEIRRNLDLPSTAASRGLRIASLSYETLTLENRDSHVAFRKRMEEEFGRVDVLVNNAATAFKGSDPTPFREQCKPTLDVNFRGTVSFTEEMFPLLRKGTDARIVNVASMAGRLSQLQTNELRRQFTSQTFDMEELLGRVDNFESDVMAGRHVEEGWGNSNYGMSKLALIAATRIWAREEGPRGVRVNSCCPGYCDTDMTSHRGPRLPSEGARNAVLPATMKNCPTGEHFADYGVAEW